MSLYGRNFPVFSAKDFEIIQNTSVYVVGCGGLEGYVIEMLARIGIGSLILIDGAVFEESNLNRQLFATEKENILRNKLLYIDLLSNDFFTFNV